MNVSAVREAMADALRDVGSVQVNPYALSQPTPPGLQILPPARSYHYTPELSTWTFIVQGFVAFTQDIAAQMQLDAMISDGPNSVRDLLEADKTLGGLVDTLVVTESSPGRMVENPGGNPMLLVEWRVTVYADGS